MIPVHEQRLRAERDAAVKRVAELESQLLRVAYRESLERPDQLRERRAQAVAERDAAVAARDEHGKSIGDAIQALHDAGVLSFGTVAEGIAKLAAERDAAKAETVRQQFEKLRAELAEARDAIKGKTFFCAKCEETERALREWSDDILTDLKSKNRRIRQDAHGWQAQLDARGLWRDPAPTDQDDGGEGGR